MDRRRFLQGVTATLSMAALARMRAFATAPADTRKAATGRAGLTPAQWQVIAAVQAHLLPSEPEAPGAKDANALEYLMFMLGETHTDPMERALIRDGVERLERIVRKQGVDTFTRLDAAGRETALRTLEKQPEGRTWIIMLLDYLFEALLADPVYGSNPGGIGWKWLEFHPGYRQPPPDKRFFLL